MAGQKKTLHLRKGFTTGTCAAAGAKAAAQALFGAMLGRASKPKRIVNVTLPNGGSIKVKIKSIRVEGKLAEASVIKDAGDDPDVTNGEEIMTSVELIRLNKTKPSVRIKGGEGVGVVTRPGLKIPPGRPAINPVPLEMIKKAVIETAEEFDVTPSVAVTVTVPRGRLLAEKTMNPRLGIVGGISILGTTGIVEPLSLCAYRNSITCAIDVATAGGMDEVVFSTGRSTERVVEKRLKRLPEIAFVLTGDHMGAALDDASKKPGLRKVTIAGQFGKISKLAAGHFETHRDDSSVELDFIAGLCVRAGKALKEKILKANTAREVFFILKDEGRKDIFREILRRVRVNAKALAGSNLEIRCVLVGYEDDIVSTF